MTNMSYMIFTALVMLLQITNLSVSYDIICTGYTALWSDTIPKWNVQLFIGIQSHLFLFQQQHHDTTLSCALISFVGLLQQGKAVWEHFDLSYKWGGSLWIHWERGLELGWVRASTRALTYSFWCMRLIGIWFLGLWLNPELKWKTSIRAIECKKQHWQIINERFWVTRMLE